MLSILMATLLVQATADGPTADSHKLPKPEVFTSESQTGSPTPDSPRTSQQESPGQSKVQGADRVDQERPCSAEPVEAQQGARPVAVDDAWFAWLPLGCVALGIIASVLIGIQWRAQRGSRAIKGELAFSAPPPTGDGPGYSGR
jgi:hypothetical protein